MIPTAGFTRRRSSTTREGSLGELETLCRDAARATGLAWGLAEEAGAAVRWLEARRLPGAALALRWLQRRGDETLASVTPGKRPLWMPAVGRLCPFVAGAALADLSLREVVLGPVAAPLLLAPFAAQAARANATPLELAWEGGLVCLAVDGEGCRTDGPGLDLDHVAAVSLHPAAAAVQPGRARSHRPELPAALWDQLTALASRVRTADGVNDNDVHRGYAESAE